MFGMFFRGVRITWRLFRALPKSVQRIIEGVLVVMWVLGIVMAYGMASNSKREQATAQASTSASPSAPEATPVPSTPAAPATTVTPASTQRVPGLARGCLGGENPSTAVFTAQQEAPLTPEGAAEFAASYVRWIGRYPHIGDPAEQGVKLWAPDATALVRQAGQWPAGMPETSVYASLLKGRFKVTDFTPASAKVSIYYDVVSTKSSGTSTETQSSTFVLSVVNGHWQVRDSKGVLFTPEQLETSGQPFVGGC